MRFLNWIDYGVIGLYFAILISIGRILQKRATSSMENYFLGGRRVPWWLLGVSGMAAWLDMTGTMVITSFLFMMGPRGLFVEFRGGAGLVLIFLLLWQGKWHRRSGCMTQAEWMIFRFGSGTGGNIARLMAVISTMVFNMGLLIYSFFGGGLFLSMFLPWQPWVCMLILLIVTIIYTAEAGFLGVVVTDLFQMLIVVFAAIFIAIMALTKLQGYEGTLSDLAQQVTGNLNWTSSLPSLHTEMPAGYEQFSGLLFVTLFYLAKTIIQGLGVGGEPKYFGARSDRECGLLSFLCGWLMSIRWFLMIGFVILGLFLVQEQFQDKGVLARTTELIKAEVKEADARQWSSIISELMNHPDRFSPELIAGIENELGPDWANKISLVSFEGTTNTERILPAVLLSYVPMGVRGLILVALLAAAMSTFNSFINMTTAFFTKDIYQNYIRPQASNRQLMYVSYIFGVVFVGVSFLLAFTIRNINDIWEWITMGLAGGLIVPLFLRLFWWRFNGGGFFVGTLVGLTASILVRVYAQDMPGWQQFLLTTVIGMGGSIIGTYCSKPTERAVLENFYRKTRPLGLWNPMQHVLTEDQRQRTRKEHWNDLLASPFAFFWGVTILLLPMQLMIGTYRAAAITAGILAVSLIGLYWFWYRHLPQVDLLSAEIENTRE